MQNRLGPGHPRRKLTRTWLESELLHLQLVFPFFNQIKLVGFNIVEDLPLPTRHVTSTISTRVALPRPKLARRSLWEKIAGSAGDLADLRQPASHNADARSHRIAVTLSSNEFEIEEMIPITAAILQQQGRVSIVGYDHVHEGNGKFVETTKLAGSGFQTPHVGRGVAFADSIMMASM
jgi:hypothetical protein